MFRGLIDRLRGTRAGPVPATASPPAVPATASPPAVPIVPGPPPRAPRAPGPPPVGIGARRPLVAPDGTLAGFEFHAGAAGRGRLRRQDDEVTIRAVVGHVLGAMRLCLDQRLTPLAEVPATWLARTDDDQFAAGMLLALARDGLFDDAAALARLIGRLRRAGCRVGWQVGPDDAGGPLPDFLLVAAPTPNDRAGWQRASAEFDRRWPGVDQVLLDLPDIDALESLLRPPVVLGACAQGGASPRGQAVALSPQTTTLLRLLARLARDEGNALLTADIKADAALGLRLLQYLNSAGATPGRPLDSIDQAVMVLGRDALYRWAAQMVVRLAPARESSAALQAMALARARFLELLARAAGDPQAGQLYLFGLVSMLPRLLGCSLEDAVASLSLPAAAPDALLRAAGPWQPYLALAQAIDGHDLTTAAALAERFDGLPAVLALSAKAWVPA